MAGTKRRRVVLCSSLAFAAAAACHARAPDTPSEAITPRTIERPSFPANVELPSELRGAPLRVSTLEGGVIVETFADGSGDNPAAVTGKRAYFLYSGYDAVTGERRFGSSETWPARLIVGADAGNPIDEILQKVIVGRHPWGLYRVFVPAAILNASKPARAPALGDLWLTVKLVKVDELPALHELSAYTGRPTSSEVLDSGLRILEYADGEGHAAEDGDLVEYHYIMTSLEGEIYLSSHRQMISAEITLGSQPSSRFDEGLRGAKAGMLRKLVFPAGLVVDQMTLPKGFIMYIEVTRVEPTSG